MASAIDGAIAEIKAKLAEMEPQHEGLRDFASLDLKDETRGFVQEFIAQYDRRVELLNTALDALINLSNDGHPEIPAKTIPEEALDDLNENKSTIDAALAKFKAGPGQAVSLGLGGGTPESK